MGGEAKYAGRYSCGRVRFVVSGEPAAHVQLRETMLPIHDGQPRMRDLPAQRGGSGITSPESPA